MTKLTAAQVADYFLSKTDSPESEDAISNLKLQKLLYYAQGYHLAIFGKPLFDDHIVAWEHGPVVKEIYYKYSEHGHRSIPAPDSVDVSRWSHDTIDFLDAVYEVVGQYSAWKLRNMTHQEPPWKDTPRNGRITHKSLRDYFKTCLKD